MKNMLKVKARMKVGNMIKSGKLIRNPFCLRCYKKAFTDAHHTDYAKPLLIEWLCSDCHDKEHYDLRYKMVQNRKKIFDPCACGKKAICRNMCPGCYARWRITVIKEKCLFPACENFQHMRGLCIKHRQQDEAFRLYALPRQRPGTKPH